MPPAALSSAINRLWLPRPSLSTCLRGVMSRDTRGVVLNDEQRFNYFPASPLCSISWWFEGLSELLPPGARATLDAPRETPPSRLLFSGPRTGPTVSWNPAPAHGMMLLLMPDALQRLTGIEVQPWVDRFADAAEVLPAPWLAMCDEVMRLADDEARVAMMQDFLQPHWEAQRPRLPLQLHRYEDWSQAVALRAATSGPGRSLRQIERRIKQWTGLPLRELRGLSRGEQAFFHGLAAVEQGARPQWAELADATGFADQSHLCRETRRITGFTPEELFRRIKTDEGFWSYRLWQ
jgi:AraC-like DNA-binding protein